MAWNIELLMVPVTEVDRAKAVYLDQVGFNADQDNRVVKENLRFVKLTPPGWACSITIGEGTTEMAPVSLQGIQVVVDHVEAARAALIANSVEVSAIEDQPWERFVFTDLTGPAVPCSSSGPPVDYTGHVHGRWPRVAFHRSQQGMWHG